MSPVLGRSGSAHVAHFTIERVGERRLEASGALGFDSAGKALPAGLALIPKGQPLTIDLSRVTEADSAGLAVLVEWLATARLRGSTIHYEAIPAQILAVARISELESLLIDSQ